MVMSDSEDSTVTYTKASSLFEDLSNIRSPGVDGLPMMPKDTYAYVEAALLAPPYPDYVPNPEHPLSPAYVPEFVPEPVYTEFMPLEDDVLPAEEQPLPAAASHTADSPGYIPESDLDEGDEDPEEDPADYPTDREDDDDEEDESSKDDADEEEEHPAPTDSIPPPLVHRTTARISISAQAHVQFMSEAEVEKLLALPTLPPSLLTPYSSPLPHIPSPPHTASPTYPLGYRAAMIRLRVEPPSTSHPLPPIVLPYTMASMAMIRAAAPFTYILAPLSETPPSGTSPLLPIPLPTSSLPSLLPSTVCRADVLEVTLLPHKRLCIALGQDLRSEIVHLLLLLVLLGL
nr:hypothetical protein [Tanacetum cinerariifolium]